MYCLCVNGYCTADTGRQPNCSYQIYQHTLCFVSRSQRSVTTPDRLSAIFGSTHICERLFSQMDTAQQRTEIDPTMKDHTAVFAFQLLIYIPVSTFVWPTSRANFRSKLLFFLNRSEQRINKCKTKDKWKTNKMTYMCAVHFTRSYHKQT